MKSKTWRCYKTADKESEISAFKNAGQNDHYPRGIGGVAPDGDKSMSALLSLAANDRSEPQKASLRVLKNRYF
jgi:hypothetical protein